MYLGSHADRMRMDDVKIDSRSIASKLLSLNIKILPTYIFSQYGNRIIVFLRAF